MKKADTLIPIREAFPHAYRIALTLQRNKFYTIAFPLRGVTCLVQVTHFYKVGVRVKILSTGNSLMTYRNKESADKWTLRWGHLNNSVIQLQGEVPEEDLPLEIGKLVTPYFKRALGVSKDPLPKEMDWVGKTNHPDYISPQERARRLRRSKHRTTIMKQKFKLN